jgi:hypothetical protein
LWGSQHNPDPYPLIIRLILECASNISLDLAESPGDIPTRGNASNGEDKKKSYKDGLAVGFAVGPRKVGRNRTIDLTFWPKKEMYIEKR